MNGYERQEISDTYCSKREYDNRKYDNRLLYCAQTRLNASLKFRLPSQQLNIEIHCGILVGLDRAANRRNGAARCLNVALEAHGGVLKIKRRDEFWLPHRSQDAKCHQRLVNPPRRFLPRSLSIPSRLHDKSGTDATLLDFDLVLASRSK